MNRADYALQRAVERRDCELLEDLYMHDLVRDYCRDVYTSTDEIIAMHNGGELITKYQHDQVLDDGRELELREWSDAELEAKL